MLGQQPGEQVVGQSIAIVSQAPRVEATWLRPLPKFGQRYSRLVCEVGGKTMVVERLAVDRGFRGVARGSEGIAGSGSV